MQQTNKQIRFSLKYQTSFRLRVVRRYRFIVCKRLLFFFSFIRKFLKKKHRRLPSLDSIKITFTLIKPKRKSIIINRAPYRYKLAKNNLTLTSYFFVISLTLDLEKPIQLSPNQRETFKKIVTQLRTILMSLDTSLANLKDVTITADIQLQNLFI